MATERGSSGYPRPCRLLLFCSLAALILALVPIPASAQQSYKTKTEICNAIGKSISGSSGLQMYCFGPQRTTAAKQFVPSSPTKGLANVDAANTSEDRTGSGVYIPGQSETSIAASGKYVVEAWNDATGFENVCGAPMYKEELTGYAFSTDGGKTFTDYGGLVNPSCSTGTRWEGDPSVGVYQNSGLTYFYISSLYACSPAVGCPNYGLAVAISPCEVTGTTLTCYSPVIAATSNCNDNGSGTGSGCGGDFSFLDKDFLAVDEANRRLYLTFTDFDNADYGFATTIEAASCDLSVNPLTPVCSDGTSFGPPYVTVQAGDNVNFCEYEGAYPAVDPANGDLYAAFEYNWFTNAFGSVACVTSTPTLDIVAYIPSSCLTDPSLGPSPCVPSSFTENANAIISMDGSSIPGYNRGFGGWNDFPRIAISDRHGTVSIVWNDARNHPLGQIFLQSYQLATLNYIQSSPVQINSDKTTGLHGMPGLRNDSGSGLLNIGWYDRRLNPNSTKTDYFAALNVSPLATTTPSNERISNVSNDWAATTSLIIPNFGDYTDSFVSSSNIAYFTWSDGRIGVPQPEVASETLH